MKKVLSLLLAVLFALTLCACNLRPSDGNGASEQKLVYGEKYMSSGSINGKSYFEHYVLFEDDGYADYYYKTVYQDTGKKYHYKITCRYEIVDDGVVCLFYDSAKIYSDDNTTVIEDLDRFTRTFIFSENVLLRATSDGYTYFFRESYAENEIPNFGSEG